MILMNQRTSDHPPSGTLALLPGLPGHAVTGGGTSAIVWWLVQGHTNCGSLLAEEGGPTVSLSHWKGGRLGGRASRVRLESTTRTEGAGQLGL